MKQKSLGKGLIFGFLAFSIWGTLPLYWKLLSKIDPLHILALRIFLSLALVGIILLVSRNSAWLTVFKNPKKACFLTLTAIILCGNWGLYIWAVNRGHTLDASLGYFINPLVSIVLGLLFYRERLPPLQWAAIAIAAAGVIILGIFSGALPWISLALAVSFGLYGLMKKKSPLSALESLGAETLASVPIGFMLLLFSYSSAPARSLFPVFTGTQGLLYFGELPVHVLVPLAFCGVVSALPLYLFAQSAKLLPLSTLGFAQFISPTLQFFWGLFVFGESFPPHHFIAFALIWIAVILYVVSLRPKQSKQ